MDEEIESMDEQEREVITSGGLNNNIRRLIDIAIESGMEPEEVEGILRDHADGVKYYYRDYARYNSSIE